MSNAETVYKECEKCGITNYFEKNNELPDKLYCRRCGESYKITSINSVCPICKGDKNYRTEHQKSHDKFLFINNTHDYFTH